MEKLSIRLAKSLIGRGKEQIPSRSLWACIVRVTLSNSLTTPLPPVRSPRSLTWSL